MTQENVELVRRTIDLFNRREIDRALDGVADDFEMDWSNSIGPLRGLYRGRDEARGLWEAFLDAWDEVRWHAREIIEVDDNRVVVVNRVRMRGESSGIDVQATGVQLWTIHNGKARAIKLYGSKADALAAAGAA
jgi:ketosteroid isomerase-like protein